MVKNNKNVSLTVFDDYNGTYLDKSCNSNYFYLIDSKDNKKLLSEFTENEYD